MGVLVLWRGTGGPIRQGMTAVGNRPRTQPRRTSDTRRSQCFVGSRLAAARGEQWRSGGASMISLVRVGHYLTSA
jgi:hypothetical protein